MIDASSFIADNITSFFDSYNGDVNAVKGKTLVNSDGNVYRFIGGNTKIPDLSVIDYCSDSWELAKVDANNFTQDVANNKFLSTFQNQNKSLSNGDIVQNKRAVERLTLQLFDDVDIEASESLSIDAGNTVVVDTTGDFLIKHVKADGDARIKAAGGIFDLGVDSEAAISTFGDLVMSAGTSIEAANHTDPLRIQLSPDNKLSVDVFGNLRLKQVSADLSNADFDSAVTGVSNLVINDLIAFRINAGGLVEIEVAEGDLYLGRVSAGISVDLRAQSDILDFNDDADSPVVNIFTGNVVDPATGNVYLKTSTGNIGTATNFVDVEIRKGDLNALIDEDAFINSVRDLNVGEIISTDGNVTLTVDGLANIGLITALGDGVPDSANSLSDGLVTINAATNIIDRRNDNTPNIVATGAILIAGLGVGSAGNFFDTQISRLEASIPGGGIWLDNTGVLQIGNISSMPGIQALDTVYITAHSTITVNEAIDSVDGPITLVASDDIIVNAAHHQRGRRCNAAC